jgi:hypothetical protein
LGNGIGVLAYVGGERHDWIAGPLTNAPNIGGGIALEYCGVLGKSDLLRGVLEVCPRRPRDPTPLTNRARFTRYKASPKNSPRYQINLHSLV